MIIRKGNTEEIYHGVSVPDPYRWLEDENLNETKEWTAYQNNMTRRNKIKKKLTQLMNYPKYSPPQRKGDYYFFLTMMVYKINLFYTERWIYTNVQTWKQLLI
nr:hypothetical protein [Virgibacillus pantothenticus]